MTSLEFHNPHFLWLLLLIPLLAYLSRKVGKSAALLFSSVRLARGVCIEKKSGSSRLLFFMRLMALVVLIVALARPQLGKGESYIEASGIDIILAVDISGSMLALDFSTKDRIVTRIDIVKEVLDDFIDKRPNDRIGIIAFAGDPYLVSPLTLNHDWLSKNLERLRPGLVADGTAIGNALAMSVNRLKDLPSKSRVVILLTDGENTAGDIPPLVAAELAQSFSTKVYTIAAGKSGVVYTYLLDRNGNVSSDSYGNPLIYTAESKADQETLFKIAEMTKGKAFHADNTQDLDKIYGEINQLERTEVKLKQYDRYEDLFAYPLVLGLLMIGVERLLANTRFRRIP